MSNIHSLSAHALVKPCFQNAITAASNNGAAIDTLGYENGTAIFYSSPSGSGTTSDCKLQECATSGGTYADVTSATFAQVTTAGGAQIQVMDINLEKRLRYLRLVHTGAGGSAAGQASGVLVLSGARNAPPTQNNTVVTV